LLTAATQSHATGEIEVLQNLALDAKSAAAVAVALENQIARNEAGRRQAQAVIDADVAEGTSFIHDLLKPHLEETVKLSLDFDKHLQFALDGVVKIGEKFDEAEKAAALN
jgi:pantoate kinase